jgi:hypothetical protein
MISATHAAGCTCSTRHPQPAAAREQGRLDHSNDISRGRTSDIDRRRTPRGSDELYPAKFHVLRWQMPSTVAEIARVLAPGGRLVATMPDRTPLRIADLPAITGLLGVLSRGLGYPNDHACGAPQPVAALPLRPQPSPRVYLPVTAVMVVAGRTGGVTSGLHRKRLVQLSSGRRRRQRPRSASRRVPGLGPIGRLTVRCRIPDSGHRLVGHTVRQSLKKEQPCGDGACLGSRSPAPC